MTHWGMTPYMPQQQHAMALPSMGGLGDLGFGDIDRDMRRMERMMNREFGRLGELVPAHGALHRGMDQGPVVTEKDGKREMHIDFDVRHFKPEEVNVVTKDGVLSVSAKHEERDGEHHVYREYKRMFTLPKEVKPETLESQLHRNGLLTVKAPLPEQAMLSGTQVKIPIKHH